MMATIEFTPYRGAIEPVTKTHMAKVVLRKQTLEIMLHYEFTSWDQKKDRVRMALVIPREALVMERGTIVHEMDTNEEILEVVQFWYAGGSVYVKAKGKECDRVYQAVLGWMESI